MQSLKNNPGVLAVGVLVGAAADFAFMRASSQPEKIGMPDSVVKTSDAQPVFLVDDARAMDPMGASVSSGERPDIMAAARRVAREEVLAHMKAFAQGAAKRADEQSEIIIAAAREVAQKEAQAYIQSGNHQAIKTEALDRPDEETRQQRYENAFRAWAKKTEQQAWEQKWERERQEEARRLAEEAERNEQLYGY